MLLSICSMIIILYPWFFSSLIAVSASSKYFHATDSVAPRAVF